jgi:hypothetical protein
VGHLSDEATIRAKMVECMAQAKGQLIKEV